jgi:hypothetical protein
MRVLTIRNISDETYRAIALRAQRNRRSLQQEALLLLERGRALDKAGGLEKAKTLREQLSGRPLGNSVNEVREERRR